MNRSGDARVVDDVGTAFAELVHDLAPSSIALSGGATARRCYQALARHPPGTWSHSAVWFGDERWVPVDDPESNEGMARAALLGRVPPGDIHSLRGAGSTRPAAADAYDQLLRSVAPLDLVHLGLGADGHTASLFPGSPALEVRDRLVVATGDERHPHPRLTFTFPALERAAMVVFTVAGADKREALARVRAGDRSCPAARVECTRVVWLVEPDAM